MSLAEISPAIRRRTRQREEARRAILDATEELLLEVGYDDFSMRRLVERCGYAAPSIYHYFGDKDGLIGAETGSIYRSLVPESWRICLDDAGHVIHLDEPDLFAELAVGFLLGGKEA